MPRDLSALQPSLSQSIMNDIMNKRMMYNCFELKQRYGDYSDEKITISLHIIAYFTLNKFRDYLWENFGVTKNSRISYIDNDGDELPIDSECEFLEALKFVRTSVKSFSPTNEGVPLLVDSINHKKQCSACDALDREYRKNLELAKQRHPNWPNASTWPRLEKNRCTECKAQDGAGDMEKTVPSSFVNSNTVTSMATKEVADKMNEMRLEDIFREPNISARRYSDSSPPSWFADYMGSMKRDMVSAITHEVSKNVMEMLNKRLDSFASLVTEEIARGQSHLSLPKRHTRCSSDSHSTEKNQKRKRTQDEEHSSDVSFECEENKQQNTNNTKDHVKQKLQEKLNYEFIKLDKKTPCVPLDGDDEMNNDTSKEQKESVGRVQVGDSIYFEPNDLRISNHPSQSTQNGARKSETPEILDMLRMNCSVTGLQMLDEARCKDPRYRNALDADNVSVWSNSSNAADDQEDDTFEIIQMPISENATCPNESNAEKQNDSSRDSPSFELLSETPSPPSSMFIDEDHFSVNEGDLQVLGQETDLPRNIPYVVDIHGNVYNKDPADPDKHMNTDFEKRTGGAYAFVTQTLPVQETCTSRSMHMDQQSNEQKNSHDDVRSSHTSYPTGQNNPNEARRPEEPLSYAKMHSQCSCQSQTDSGDFTQSFHSHTISVTDNGEVYTEAEQVLRDFRATAAKNCAEFSTVPRNNIYRSGWRRKARADKSRRNDADKGRRNDADKCFCPHQLSRGSGSERSSNGSRKTSGENILGTAEPVHILPETLVTAAAHVGSIAYDTAREVFDKIRAHTREDPIKRRGRVKCDNRKPFSVGNLSFY